MKYRVIYSHAALKQLDKLEQRDYLKIYKHLVMLKENPKQENTKQLTASKLYRLRAGNFRIIYSIEEKEKLVEIVRVMRRRENTYKGL